jgi:hypothetical protein
MKKYSTNARKNNEYSGLVHGYRNSQSEASGHRMMIRVEKLRLQMKMRESINSLPHTTKN